MRPLEASVRFPCFGGSCGAMVGGPGPRRSAPEAAALVRRQLLAWHERFTRFDATSELSRLNRDPRTTVPVTPMMAALADAIVTAARVTGGLVDGTLVDWLESAGYATDLQTSVPLADAVRAAPGRRPARPRRPARWRELSVDRRARTVTRPPGVQLDSGGLAKGLFADLLARELAGHATFAVDCAGDVRLGGTAGALRTVHVDGPFGEGVIHTFELAGAAVATSGIGRRSWRGADGRPAHHLLDPSTGQAAFTGVVQATAVAPTALEAEIRAKAALLSGPTGAPVWLPHGGLVVLDDGRRRVVEADRAGFPAAA